MRRKNIYMGPNSTAGIIVHGSVDEDWEILMNTYATAFDSINGIMLTRAPGHFDPTTEQEIRGRFWVLKMLAKKYAPEKLPIIKELENMCIKHLHGKISDADFLRKIRSLVRREGLSEELINYVEARISAAEMQPPSFLPVVDELFAFPASTQPKPRKRKEKRPPSLFDIVQELFGLLG